MANFQRPLFYIYFHRQFQSVETLRLFFLIYFHFKYRRLMSTNQRQRRRVAVQYTEAVWKLQISTNDSSFGRTKYSQYYAKACTFCYLCFSSFSNSKPLFLYVFNAMKCVISFSKCTKMHLATRLRHDPLENVTLFQMH